MSDRRNEELKRVVRAGNTSKAPKLALAGVHTQDGNMIYEGIVGSLGLISRGELRRLQRAIAEKLVEKDGTTVADDFDTIKAAQIHMPDFGKITPSHLISILEDIVEGAINKDLTNVPLRDITGSYDYGPRSIRGGKSAKQHKQMAIDAFKNYSGDFVISCSSPIRIYALEKKATPEELTRRKKEEELLKAKMEHEKRLKALKEINERKRKLEEELKKAQLREERIKKKLAQ